MHFSVELKKNIEHVILSLLFLSPLITFLPAGPVHAEDGNFVWGKTIGGDSGDVGYGISVDSSGNVYTTGIFSGTVDFDPGDGTYNLTGTTSESVFISKVDRKGDFVWAKAVDVATAYYLNNDIEADASGNVYTVGSFSGASVDFDPGPGFHVLASAGNSDDIFISKLDTNGNFAWARGFGGTSWDEGRDVAVDTSGNVCSTGIFSGTVDFDPGPGTYNLVSATAQDMFISKLDNNGNFVWARAIDADVFGIAVDTSGNVYTTGFYSGTVDFDPGDGTYNLTGTGDVFISKLDSSGNFVWAKSFSGLGPDIGHDISVDSFGNVITTGSFTDTVDFDPGEGTFTQTANSTDIFISKLDGSGKFVWARKFSGDLWDEGSSVSTDAAGNVYTTGSFTATVDFDPGPGTYNLISVGGGAGGDSSDIFISKLDRNGDIVWAKAMGGIWDDSGYAIAVDRSGNVHTTGFFQDSIDLDPGEGEFIVNACFRCGDEIFISKLSGPGFFWPMFLPIIIENANH